MRHKVNILNGATVCGNQSIAQMKTQSALILSAEIALKLADKKAKKNCKQQLTVSQKLLCKPMKLTKNR